MSVYEQIKDDLGYLQLDRAAECFATLAEDARTEEWSHVEFLARLVAEQADATRNRRLSARLRYARFPFRKTIAEFDFEFQPTVDRRLVVIVADVQRARVLRAIVFLVLCDQYADVVGLVGYFIHHVAAPSTLISPCSR